MEGKWDFFLGCTNPLKNHLTLTLCSHSSFTLYCLFIPLFPLAQSPQSSLNQAFPHPADPMAWPARASQLQLWRAVRRLRQRLSVTPPGSHWCLDVVLAYEWRVQSARQGGETLTPWLLPELTFSQAEGLSSSNPLPSPHSSRSPSYCYNSCLYSRWYNYPSILCWLSLRSMLSVRVHQRCFGRLDHCNLWVTLVAKRLHDAEMSRGKSKLFLAFIAQYMWIHIVMEKLFFNEGKNILLVLNLKSSKVKVQYYHYKNK